MRGRIACHECHLKKRRRDADALRKLRQKNKQRGHHSYSDPCLQFGNAWFQILGKAHRAFANLTKPEGNQQTGKVLTQ
jgi:hypothetical protein